MQNPFSSITTAGLLLPLDLLTRVSIMDRNLPGMTPADYHVAGSIRINEAATAAYSRALTYWKSFRKKFDALPASDTGTTLTRDEWLLPLFDCLSYGWLQSKRAITIDNKEYPISHFWRESVPIHLLSARLPLDRRTPAASGAATRSPYSLVQEFLNRSSKHRWGFVSNGLKLYVLRDNASLTRSANVEFDLETMMDGEYHADFTVLFLICHQSRLEIQPTPIVENKSSNKKAAKPVKATKIKRQIEDDDVEDDSPSELDGDDEAIEIEEPIRLGPENCWLEAWTKLADSQGIAAKEKLRFGVQLAIQTFGAGFYTCTSNAVLHERLRSGELSTQDYYRQLLRLVYRLLMLMVAEDKRTESGQNLLHTVDTPAHIRDRYNKFYSIGRIRKLANERRGTPHRDLYESLKTTFLKLRDGYAPLGIPGIGSFLFSDTATPDLDTAQITNESLLDAFRHLCFTDDATGRGGSIRRAVDFGNLGSEELGSIYESLLELHPEIDSQQGPFVLRTAAGNERKTSGSYYTPTSLINCLLDSALDPVVNQAIDVPDREEAKRRLLNLKVCDPACGSGHFLIAAANRMALHLARLETQDTEPTTLQIQHAKRDIIGRCIYGVDVNPMSVELCKVSLWMEALDPGRPLSFLDHHIQCGNSLLGTTPALLARGIPDDAFNPIDGDVKVVASGLKKQNKKERTDRQRRQGQLEFEPYIKLGNLPGEFTRLSSTSDDSVADVAEKEQRYAELVSGADYQNARLLADTWCAVFVWQKDTSNLGKQCPTENDFRRIENNPHSILPHVKSEVLRLADQYQFFHWHLAFPDVFRLPSKGRAENEQTGWNGGFDVVLGNPPWDKVEILEKEWFAGKDDEISRARTGSKRKKLIASLKEREPSLYSEYAGASRQVAALRTFIQHSGRYVLCNSGRINTYSTFAETNRIVVAKRGKIGCVLPSGIATDESTKAFFQELIKTQTLEQYFDFENKRLIFDGVAPVMRFCLLTLRGSSAASYTQPLFVFFAQGIDDTKDPRKLFSLDAEALSLINPNTGTCPIFMKASEAVVAKHIYGRTGVLLNHAKKSNPWRIMFRQGLFNMTSDSAHFTPSAELRERGYSQRGNTYELDGHSFLPLFEAKLLQQFDHRHGTFEGLESDAIFNTKAATKSPDAHKKLDPTLQTIPRYWVDANVVEEAIPTAWRSSWFLAFRDIIQPMTNARCAVFGVIPRVAVSNNMPLLLTEDEDASSLAYLLANFNSFVFDFATRQKIGGTHLNFYIVEQLPTLSPELLDSRSIGVQSLKQWLLSRVLELTYTAWDLEAFALDCGYTGPPFRWDEERRFLLRCELDAAYFHLYLGPPAEWGTDSPQLSEMFPTPRDAVDYIMDTFPIVRRKDEAKYGEYRTKRVILEIYDQMTEIIEANEAIRAANPGKSEEELRPLLRSYQSPLNPPPGPPTDANGNFIPYADWTDEIRDLYASVIHLPKVELRDLTQEELALDILLVLEAWRVPASIRAIEGAMLLLRDDQARANLVSRSRTPTARSSGVDVTPMQGISQIYDALCTNGVLEPVGTAAYRLLNSKLIEDVPESEKAKATQAVDILKSYDTPEQAYNEIRSQVNYEYRVKTV